MFWCFVTFPGLAAALGTAEDVPRPAQMFRALLNHLQHAEPPAAAAILSLPLAPLKCRGAASYAEDSCLVLPGESHKGWREMFPWSQRRNILAGAPRSSLVFVPVTHLKHS